MAIAEDRRRLATRLGWLRVSVLLVFGLVAGVFWYMQVGQHARFQEMAENNHQRTLALRAPRGVIYDRTGQVLVENRTLTTSEVLRDPRLHVLLSNEGPLDPAALRTAAEW